MTYRVEEPTLWNEMSELPAQIQAEHLQNNLSGPNGYRLRRIILTNFWLYDHQEFEIPHGRLFLAGENASGKSTVMVAALPMALDGDIRPERIDTFGKREKRIDYYVIGSNESATPYTRDQRTSYVALEFEWCGMDEPPFASELREHWERGEYEKARFLTIGLVFAGNRNSVSPITTRRFLITDGSRLEKDIFTVKKSDGGRRAVDLKTFTKLVAEHGIVCETQREYEQKVAHYLFNFTDINDFRRLIRQLLYLRQPNLNSVLSLEAVRKFLDQSLPQIPSDMIQHAATTLELMDTLREEIERKAKAYQATERLHTVQEAFTVAKVRLAACEYVYQQFKENEAQGNLRRHKSNLTRAENELVRIQARMEELETERAQVNGEIAALEGSEGLQAAQRLRQVGDKVTILVKQLQEQKSILDDAIAHREQSTQDVEQQAKEFQHLRQESEQQLHTMQMVASRDAYWEIAADQLAEALQKVQRITLDDATPNISARISSLMSAQVIERLDWLRTLRQLHQDIERETMRLQAAQKQESQYYEEVDEATRYFEQERENGCSAQQNLADSLDELVEQSDILHTGYFATISERGAELCSESLSPQETVGQFDSLLHNYRQAIKNATEAMHSSISQLQQRLNELRQQQGAKEHEAFLARNAYEQKLQEAEFVPLRTEHRARARERLATAGIAAIPFYKLIDFAPEIESQSSMAGSIEYMLEDAGLLDALVVQPEQKAQAAALLAAEGLSDCQLDTEQIKNENQQVPFSEIYVQQLLRVDPALEEELRGEYAVWQATTQNILASTHYGIVTILQPSGEREQGIAWRHGLLAGQTAGGVARYIGKATRIREQQREQELLRLRWMKLSEELQATVTEINVGEQRQQELRTSERRLGRALAESGLETQTAALKAALNRLDTAQERYTRARAETQTLRQRISGSKTQLQSESSGIERFANDPESVDDAYEATNNLASEYKALQRNLEQMIRDWQGYKRANETLDRARAAEIRTANAYRRSEQETTQARSELAMLERLVQESGGEDVSNLLARLQGLQARQNEFPDQLQKNRDNQVRVETNLSTSQEELEKAEVALQLAERRQSDSYNHFASLLGAYPVEKLLLARQQLMNQAPVETAQGLLDEPLLPQEEAYLASKMILDTELNTAFSLLFQTYSEVSNLLHAYGPTMDDQNFVHFANAENVNAFELLTRLAEEIKQQERLLEDKERVLFQDFLLKEMADTVRKHIVDAEGWVDRINKVLHNSSFIDERYHLRWVTKEQEQEQAGGYLAQYHKLLRRQVQTFQEEEVDALVHAFRQEITALRANQQEATGIPFAEALAQVFDYRAWFRFEIYVTTVDGQNQHLSDRLLKKRSGAEQYVALYVPFFAALSALYESAGKGAPRLIALDEAFDKVSVANTQRLLKFLVAQNFQWIMTGPRITGEGTEIPACVRYLMLHQKGTELATGFASFWSIRQGELEEVQNSEEG